MKKAIYIVLLCGVALQLEASIPVPAGLRNPFEVPDPTALKSETAKATPAKKAVDPAVEAREKQFAQVREKLLSLKVKGIAADYRNPDGTTVLIGSYTVKTGMELPASDFSFPGLIRIVSVTPTEIVVNVSIELETRKMTIPLVR